MSPSSDTAPRRGSHRSMARTLGLELVVPLALFYGMRAVGVDQLLALVIAAIPPAINAARTIALERRVSGITAFVLAAMALSVAMSFVTGSPRALLLRDAWATAAMGLWILITLLARRPFLYDATRIFLDDDKQSIWAWNWELFPQFRHALRVSTVVWGCAFLTDTAIRVLMALTLPVDLVPALEYVLLAVTVLLLLGFQKFYGARYLRRHELRLRGVHLSQTHTPRTSNVNSAEQTR